MSTLSPESLTSLIHIEVAGTELAFRTIHIDDSTPTARQVLAACEQAPHDQFAVLQWLASGDIEEIRLEETVKVEAGGHVRLIIDRADRLYRFILNDHSMLWPEGEIAEAALRKLSGIAENMMLFQRREDEADQEVPRSGAVNLAARGTEEIYSRKQTWKLNVQGVHIVSDHSEITVREAMLKAGFDIAAAWIIVLKTAIERRQVGLDYVIDLRLPGVEKLRLTPKEINNGEVATMPDLAFPMLASDEKGLGERGLNWTTRVEGNRRWLILNDFDLPTGFNVGTATIAMEIPTSYPAAEIDMFYVTPHLARCDGQLIPQTQVSEQIGGRSYQRWSRHRGAQARWQPGKDSVLTHLALIDASLAREVEQ